MHVYLCKYKQNLNRCKIYTYRFDIDVFSVLRSKLPHFLALQRAAGAGKIWFSTCLEGKSSLQPKNPRTPDAHNFLFPRRHPISDLEIMELRDDLRNKLNRPDI